MSSKWFTARTIEELRRQYKELLKQHHPDNGGRVKDMQSINAEYDRLASILSRSDGTDEYSATDEENAAYRAVMERIAGINADIEVIGSWIWVTKGGYEYRSLLKEIGFRYAPKKKCWCWHHGEYSRRHKREIPLDEIRAKYGTQNVGWGNHYQQRIAN